MTLLAGALVTFIVTLIVTDGYVFSWLRKLALRVHRHLGYLFSCFMCFGTWVGIAVGFFVDGPTGNPVLDGLAYQAAAYVLHALVALVTSVSIRMQQP